MDGELTATKPDAQEANSFLQEARALPVTCPDEYAAAADKMLAYKAWLKSWNEYHEPEIVKAHDLHKSLCAKRKVGQDAVNMAIRYLESKLRDFDREQEALRIAEQKKLQAEADARAAKRRGDLEKKAAAAKRPETQAKYQQQAQQVATPVVSVAPVTPQVNGLVKRKVWKFRIVDAQAIPREYLKVDEERLGRYARAMGANARVAGVTFFQEEQLAAKGR